MNKKIHPVKSPQGGVAKGEFNRVKKLAFIIAWIFTIPAFGLSQVSFWKTNVHADDNTTTTDSTDSQASDIQDSISSLQKKLEKEQSAEDKLQQNLGQVKGAVSSTQTAINQTQAAIQETENEISRKEDDIKNLNDQIELQKTMLGSFLQEAYYVQNQPILNVILTENNLRDIFSYSDQLMTLEDKIVSISNDIANNKTQAEQDQVQLAQTKQEHEKILNTKIVQKQNLLANQSQIQAAIQDKQTTISQLQGELNDLKDQYSRALGKSVSTDDIVKAAAFAAKATGMKKAFLLGVLVQESNKGQNVGGCNYKTSKMTSTQLTAFKSINKELGYDYTKKPVSCPSSAYKGTGGAMGVAQFMPTTWQGYKSTIASLSGDSPPDPWDLVDGVVAMASKLSNDGADSQKRFDEAKSYCVYLAGGNWGYYCYGSASKYKDDYSDVNCSGSSIHNYGEKVLCLMDNYDKYY
jgi:septal ring factor EnvC (AmiA/AmiB activator)